MLIISLSLSVCVCVCFSVSERSHFTSWDAARKASVDISTNIILQLLLLLADTHI